MKIITLPLPCQSRTHEPPLAVQPRHLLFVPSTFFEQLLWEKRRKLVSKYFQGFEENLNNDETKRRRKEPSKRKRRCD